MQAQNHAIWKVEPEVTEAKGNRDRGTRTITLDANVHKKASKAAVDADDFIGDWVGEACTRRIALPEAPATGDLALIADAIENGNKDFRKRISVIVKEWIEFKQQRDKSQSEPANEEATAKGQRTRIQRRA